MFKKTLLNMKNITFDLHPKPELSDIHPETNIDSQKSNMNTMLGKHCILELYECNSYKLNDEAFIRTTLNLATKHAGATMINMITHKFEPQGVTGLALLSESHISIHTWPEINYAAIDIFTCGSDAMPDRACQFLIKEFNSQKYELKKLIRSPLGN